MATVITAPSTQTLTVDNCQRFAKTKEAQAIQRAIHLHHICFAPTHDKYNNSCLTLKFENKTITTTT
jgi:hypothetical protein